MWLIFKDRSVSDSDSDDDVGVIVARANMMQKGRKRKQGIDSGAHASEAKNSESAPVNVSQIYTDSHQLPLN